MPRVGHVLVQADFNQLALRVLAYLSQDPVLLREFCTPGTTIDLHRRTAALVLEIPEAQITNRQRNQIGKPTNCGISQGQTEFGLANVLGTSPERACQFMERFFRRYSGVRRWFDATELHAVRDGFVQTPFGRRRILGELNPWDEDPGRAMRQAVNFAVQAHRG